MWLITCRNRATIYAICCVLTFLVYKFSIYQKIRYCQERLSQSSAVMIFIFIPKPFSALILQSKVTFFCIISLTAQNSSIRFSHFDSHSTICSYFLTTLPTHIQKPAKPVLERLRRFLLCVRELHLRQPQIRIKSSLF